MTQESDSFVKTHRQSLLAITVLLVLATSYGGMVGAAKAGSYSVAQCDYERAITTSSFAWQSSGVPSPIQHANSGCGEFGLAGRSSGIGTTRTYPDGASGGYLVNAPLSTEFTRFSGEFGTLSSCCISGMEAYAVARENDDGSGGYDEIFRGSLGSSTWPAPSGSQGPVSVAWDSTEAGFNARQIGYFVGCASPIGCAQSTTGDVRVRGRTFEFTLQDLEEPQVMNLSGELMSDDWVRGEKDFDISATDEGGGLVGIEATAEGQSILDAPSTCSEVDDRYVDLRPCPLSRNGSWTVDTREFNDGLVALNVGVEDVGGATANESVTLQIDNTPPAAPTGLSLEGGQGWQSHNDFGVSWDDPRIQHAPVVRTHFQLCEVPEGACEVGDREGEGIGHLAVPHQGEFSLRLWLEDAAGNADAESLSDPIVLRFDDGVPGRVQIGAPSGWLGISQSNSLSVDLALEPGANSPVSGTSGYSVTTNGSQPDSIIDAVGPAASYELGQLPEGETTVRARAVSGAGVSATSVGAASLKIDRSSPFVTAAGIPEPFVWRRSTVLLQLSSVDQVGLSGVQAAPMDSPITEGGYLTFRLNGGPVQELRGDHGSAAVDHDGVHTLTYRAFDAAGNASVQKEAVFRIDGTAPVGVFRALDPEDPRKLLVEVGDATSGVADGRIEYRKVGDGEFRPLVTRVGAEVLTARLDDEGLPAGRYEMRAVVRDVAGNEAVVDKWVDGSATTLAMPLRLGAHVEVAGSVKAKRCGKATRKGRAKQRKRSRRRQQCQRAPKTVTSLELRHGKRAVSTGRLTTSQGAAIPHSAILVEGQARSGGPFVRLGTATTDGQGKFQFKIPAGPSRTVRYRYDGTNTVRSASASLTTKVTAAARLEVNRRRLRNGQTVRFSGKLLGRPIPAEGKLVALQAKVGREWRTFANPRANVKGAFKHRYRFTATTGLRRYAFRAVVAREAAYPYEAGKSPVVRVTVRGARR